MDKGLVTIGICLTAAAAGLVLRVLAPSMVANGLFYIGMAGLIGSFTNRMAITALFHRWPTRRFALPYTGLIERHREQIVQAVSDAVAREIITPQALGNWMREANFLQGLRDAAATQIRRLSDPEGDGADLRRDLADVLRTQMMHLVDSSAFYYVIRNLIRDKTGLAGRVGHWTGLTDYDYVTNRIILATRRRLGELFHEHGGLPSQEMQILIPAVARRLEEWDVSGSPAVERLLGVLVDQIDVHQIVSHSLGRFTPEQVRILVHRLSREHLAWLEVYGGIFGAIGGALMWLLA